VVAGERVGAILGSNKDGSIDFFGYGVYEGDFIPLEAVGFVADIIREMKHTNPRIRIDNGQIVYGSECWWGSEDKVMKMLEGKVVNKVSIETVRSNFLEDNK
jgi:hypothetical protein